MKIVMSLISAIAVVAILLVWLYPRDPVIEITTQIQEQETISKPAVDGPIPPIPTFTALNAGKVSLGEKLFNDPILSKDNTISCASCHDLGMGGTNGLPVSVGIGGAVMKINVPTVFNSSLNFKQFWDGRAESLEEQVSGPVQNPLEMGATWEGVIKRLNADVDYKKRFDQLYDGGITVESVSHAVAEFERSLMTPNSDFDRFLMGDSLALSADAVAGYELFLQLGCVDCHQGVGIGGNMFQRMGAKHDYFGNRGEETKHDLGRFNVTGEEFDKYRFKVPSLRNIALTAPYFHNGSATKLSDAVAVMAKYQLGRRLKNREQELLVAFLESLTGEYQGKKLTRQLALKGGESE